MKTTNYELKKKCMNCSVINHFNNKKCSECGLIFLKELKQNDKNRKIH